MFSRSPGKRWVIDERHGKPCLIDARTSTEEWLGATTEGKFMPAYGNEPLTNDCHWHPRQDMVVLQVRNFPDVTSHAKAPRRQDAKFPQPLNFAALREDNREWMERRRGEFVSFLHPDSLLRWNHGRHRIHGTRQANLLGPDLGAFRVFRVFRG